MLRFKDIQDHVHEFEDQSGTTTAHPVALVKYAINASYEKRMTEDRWSFNLWPSLQTFTFTTGRNYVLHPEAAIITDFKNRTSNTPMRDLQAGARYKTGVQDSRNHYEMVLPTPVKSQPGEGVVTVTGNARLRYIGIDEEFYEEDIEDTTTAREVSEILEVTKLDDASLTLTSAAAVTLLSLTSSQYGKSYPQIRLLGDGVAGEIGEYRFYRKPRLLVHDNDIPFIPYPFSRIMVYDALLEMATYDDSQPPQYWVAQQEILDRQMRQAFIEGEDESSERRTIRIVDEYEG